MLPYVPKWRTPLFGALRKGGWSRNYEAITRHLKSKHKVFIFIKNIEINTLFGGARAIYHLYITLLALLQLSS
ncbi:MAG: hypothetical protein MUQ33_05960, partial [Burkholderiaceae bacterium]|nr:hypothetical protein [Burkholderiaceae bacterium]